MPDIVTNILLIDTAQEAASVGWSCTGELRNQMTNLSQKEHASFLHPAIDELMKESELNMSDWHAVAVMNGPGSYTGLRVGLAAAKGICYALDLPLICINTLEWMAFGNKDEDGELMCPMIDARRTEVFYAIYDKQMHTHQKPQTTILEVTSFMSLLDMYRIHFFGSGSAKWKSICTHPNALFNSPVHGLHHFATMAQRHYANRQFNDLLLTEPEYSKEFFSTAKK